MSNMAGELQTGMFVDGQWRNENIDFNTVLKRNESKQPSKISNPGKPHSYGLLSQTVVQSPVIRWIFPVNIRGTPDDRDVVAFVSDYAVQVLYRSSRGYLQEVIRKADFGSRIRNARVSGSVQLRTESDSHPLFHDEDVQMEGIWAPKIAEYIVIVLEHGDLVFLFPRVVDDEIELTVTQHTMSRSLRCQQPGKHIAVDPSSQYMAIGGTEDMFGIYALRSIDSMDPSDTTGPVNLVTSERYLHVDGVIHKMEFLFPSSDDPDHIILALLVIKRGITRMLVYDWVAGQELRDIRSNSKKGTAVERNYRMPLLLIPLRIRSSLLLVSEKTMAVCTSILEGTPTFTNVGIKPIKTTKSYFGRTVDTPRWTAWSRPPRHQGYSKSHDDFYMAREDGVVLFIENTTDSFVDVQMEINFECNIDTAFACPHKRDEDTSNKHGDLLLVGGDSCNGGLYLVPARTHLVLLGQIPNWSPTTDFVVTDALENDHQSPVVSGSSLLTRCGINRAVKPGRVFALTGRGTAYNKALSEFRYGHEAHILVESVLDLPITEAWYLPSEWVNLNIDADAQKPRLLLFSVRNESCLFWIDADHCSIEQIGQDETWLDLSSRTLVTVTSSGAVIQVTENCVSISAIPVLNASPSMDVYRRQYPAESPILNACVYENELVVTVHQEKSAGLVMTAIWMPSNGFDYKVQSKSIKTNPGVFTVYKGNDYPFYTLISASNFQDTLKGDQLVGETIIKVLNIFTADFSVDSAIISEPIHENKALEPSVFRYVTNLVISVEIDALKANMSNAETLRSGCTSVLCLQPPQHKFRTSQEKSLVFLVGHRDGILVMIHCKQDSEGSIRICKKPSRYAVSSSPLIVKADSNMSNSAFICCDKKVWKVCFDEIFSSDPTLNQIWFTDADNPSNPQPLVDHICSLPDGLALVAGGIIQITRLLSSSPRAVLRPISLPARPFRLQYDKKLKLLVVAVDSQSGHQLIFLDPDTGRIIPSVPSSSDSRSSGIVLSLTLVDNTMSPGNSFAILGLKGENHQASGSVVVYQFSVSKVASVNGSEPRKIVYSKARKISMGPGQDVCAAAANHNVVFFCVNSEICCMMLRNDKIPYQTIYSLPSPAVSMSISSDLRLHVQTSKHSLITLEFKQSLDNFGNLNEFTATPKYADIFERYGMDQLVLAEDSDGTELVLTTDKTCSVVGLTGVEMSSPLAQDHHVLFEAELPSSIVKLRKGDTRPPWDISWYDDHKPSGFDGAEALGLTVDGSLKHFTVVNDATYRLLHFLQEYARKPDSYRSMARAGITNEYRPFHWSKEQDPRLRHLDGDFLRRFLRNGEIEMMLVGNMTWEMSGGGTEDAKVRLREHFYALVRNWLGSDVQRFDAAEWLAQDHIVNATARGLERDTVLEKLGMARSTVDGDEGLMRDTVLKVVSLLERLLRPVL